MSRFEGQRCPACRKVFGENDDIVVCPECGAPHHRECYTENGKCAMEDLHPSYVWNGELPEAFAEDIEAEAQEQSDTADSEPETAEDDEIDIETDPDDEKLDGILLQLADYANKNGSFFDWFDRDENESSEPPLDSRVESELNKVFDVNLLLDTDDMLYSNSMLCSLLGSRKKGRDGVSMLELTFFTGVSLMHYVGPFIRFMRTKRTNGFNLSSGLFMPIHQFFRKMDGWGALLLLLIAIGGLAPRILYNCGILPYSALSWTFIGVRVLFLILTVLMCLFGDRIYYKHAVRRIRKIRKHFEGKTDTVEYYLAIKDDGGTSFFRGIFGLLANVFCMVLVNNLPSMLI